MWSMQDPVCSLSSMIFDVFLDAFKNYFSYNFFNGREHTVVGEPLKGLFHIEKQTDATVRSPELLDFRSILCYRELCLKVNRNGDTILANN